MMARCGERCMPCATAHFIAPTASSSTRASAFGADLASAAANASRGSATAERTGEIAIAIKDNSHWRMLRGMIGLDVVGYRANKVPACDAEMAPAEILTADADHCHP